MIIHTFKSKSPNLNYYMIMDHAKISIFNPDIPCGSAGKESACNVGEPGLIPGLGRSPGERNSYPLQYSGLENFMVYIFLQLLLLQSCPTLCNPIDGSPLGFPIPGILQARILEWFAIFFSNA